jgi:hypothetical protein
MTGNQGLLILESNAQSFFYGYGRDSAVRGARFLCLRKRRRGRRQQTAFPQQ